MKRFGLAIVVVLSGLGLLGVLFWHRVTVRESGHGFVAGDYLVLGEYGYSDGGDRLRYAIFRTWPKDSTAAQRAIDNRTARNFCGWPLIRDKDGRMIPVGTDGEIYFYEGDKLKTMKVRMNEHDNTIPLDNLKTLDEVWSYLQGFRIDNGE
jgi:hypothetical protein